MAFKTYGLSAGGVADQGIQKLAILPENGYAASNRYIKNSTQISVLG
jgi:hypothetical protein